MRGGEGNSLDAAPYGHGLQGHPLPALQGLPHLCLQPMPMRAHMAPVPEPPRRPGLPQVSGQNGRCDLQKGQAGQHRPPAQQPRETDLTAARVPNQATKAESPGRLANRLQQTAHVLPSQRAGHKACPAQGAACRGRRCEWLEPVRKMRENARRANAMPRMLHLKVSPMH